MYRLFIVKNYCRKYSENPIINFDNFPNTTNRSKSMFTAVLLLLTIVCNRDLLHLFKVNISHFVGSIAAAG